MGGHLGSFGVAVFILDLVELTKTVDDGDNFAA